MSLTPEEAWAAWRLSGDVGGRDDGSALVGDRGGGMSDGLCQLFQANGPELVGVGGEDGGGDDDGCHDFGQRRG